MQCLASRVQWALLAATMKIEGMSSKGDQPCFVAGAGDTSQASSGFDNKVRRAIQGGTNEDIAINATQWKSFMSLNLATQFSSFVGLVKEGCKFKHNSDSSTKHCFGNRGHKFWVPKFSNESECETVYQHVIAENGECSPLKNSIDAQACNKDGCEATKTGCKKQNKMCSKVGAVQGGQEGVWTGIRCPQSMKETSRPCTGSVTVNKTEIRTSGQIGLEGAERKFTVLTIKGEYHPPPNETQVLLKKPALERGRPKYRSKCEMEYYVRLTTEDCCSPNGLVQYRVGSRALKEFRNKGGNMTEIEPTDGCKKWFSKVSTSAGAYFTYERMRRALDRTKECAATECDQSEEPTQQNRSRRRRNNKSGDQNEPQQVQTSANWGSGYDHLGREAQYFMVRKNNPMKDVVNVDDRHDLWVSLLTLVGLPADTRPYPPKLVMPGPSERGYEEHKCWNGTFYEPHPENQGFRCPKEHFASVQSTKQSGKYYPFTKFTLGDTPKEKGESNAEWENRIKCKLDYYTRLVSCRKGFSDNSKPSCMCKDENGNHKLVHSEPCCADQRNSGRLQ